MLDPQIANCESLTKIMCLVVFRRNDLKQSQTEFWQLAYMYMPKEPLILKIPCCMAARARGNLYLLLFRCFNVQLLLHEAFLIC